MAFQQGLDLCQAVQLAQGLTVGQGQAVLCLCDACQARGEGITLPPGGPQVQAGLRRLDTRQALGVRSAAQVQHVAKGLQIPVPAFQIAEQEAQLAQVFQHRLEALTGQQGQQLAVGGLGRRRRRCPCPAARCGSIVIPVVSAGGQQQPPCAPVAYALGQCREAPALGGERFGGLLVVPGGLGIGARFREGIGYREQHFLDCRFRHTSAPQLGPRYQCALQFPSREFGPAQAQQGRGRLQSVQAHSQQMAAGRLRPSFPQVQIAQGEQGPVAQGQYFLAILAGTGTRRAQFRQQGARGFPVATAFQGHGQIEAGVGRQYRGMGHRCEQGAGPLMVTLVHEHPGLQQAELVLPLGGEKGRVHLCQCRGCGGGILAAQLQARQMKPYPVAQDGVAPCVQQPLETALGLVQQPVGEEQPSFQEFGFLAVVGQGGALQGYLQAGQGSEVVALEEVEEHFSVG